MECADETGRVAGMGRLTDWVRAAGRELAVAGEVRVRVVGDDVMADLHLKHTGIAGTTDVLTFDLRDRVGNTPMGPLDVDIVICVDEAARQAASRGHSVEHELLLYVLHGVLHCLGHDDHDDAAFARMHTAEDAVLTAIGVGPVYANRANAAEGAS